MSETRMEQKQKIDIAALREALAKATPGEARLLPNGGAGMDEDPTYWGVLGGDGYYDGPGSGGFNLTGFIGEAEVQRLVLSYNALPALLDELEALRAYRDEVEANIPTVQALLDSGERARAEAAALRALTTPEPVSERHKDGNWWLVWEPTEGRWFKCRWTELGDWQFSGSRNRLFGTPTHALPMPGEPQAPRG